MQKYHLTPDKILCKCKILNDKGSNIEQVEMKVNNSNQNVKFNNVLLCFMPPQRIWAPFHVKVPIDRAHLWYVESMSTSLDYIAT